MKKRVFILISIVLTISMNKTLAAPQIPDILIYEGDTLSLFANPLEQLYNNQSAKPNFFGNKKAEATAACWRGYQAEWEIIDNSLYLTNIYSSNYSKDGIKANINDLFGKKSIEGKVKANWVTDKIIAPQGELLFQVNDGYQSIYENEVEFEFIRGDLIDTKIYDNSKTKISEYSQSPKKLQQFIYSNIRWSSLPKIENKIRVFIQFSANEDGAIDSIKVLKGHNEIFDKEAVRVIKSMPEWNVQFKRGKHKRIKKIYPVTFSAENKRKYNRPY